MKDELEMDITGSGSKLVNTLDSIINKFKSFESVSSKTSNAMKKIGDNITPTTKKIDDLSKSVDTTAHKFQNDLYRALNIKPTVDTTGFNEYKKSIDDMDKDTKIKMENIKSYHMQLADAYRSYFNKESKYKTGATPQNMNMNINEIISEINRVKAEYGTLKEELKEINSLQVAPSLDSLIKNTNDSRNAVRLLVEELKNATGTTNFLPINNALKQLEKQTGISRKEFQKLNNETNNTGSKFGKVFTLLGRVSSGLFKGVFKTLGFLGKGFIFFGKKGGDTADILNRKFKKLGLGLLGVRTVMSVLTKSVSAYLSFDGALQDSITNSWNMMGSLLAPAIEMVASLFATATNYVYNFVKALTGIDFVARANAKALKTQAAATKAAGQAQRSLSSMDEITNLQTDSAGSDAPQISAPEIDSSANKFIEDLVAKIKAGDWYGAGAYIAERINEGLEKLDVKALTDKLKQGILNITDMLNGFVETLDWTLLGQKTSDFIVGVTGAIRAGIENIHWDSIGKAISDFLNAIDWVGLVDNIAMSIMGIIKGIITAFNEIDFATLMKNLSDAFRKGLQDITKVLSEIDWKKVGNQIVDILVNIDWLGIATDIVGLLAQGLLSIGDLLIGVLDSIIDIVNDPKALSKMLEAGANLVLGLFKGMVSVIAKIGEVIGKIIELVLSLFGIHSPSTVFAEMGTNLILGLINGINSMIQGVINIFSTLWNTIVNGAKKAWEGIKNAFNSIKNFFGGIINTIMGMFKKIGTSVGNVVAGAFKGVINGVLRTIENVLNAPIRAINGLIKVINKVPGINIGKLKTFNLPRLATGTNNIPQEGIYHLHEGEAVVPKKYNPATGGYDNGADNKQIIDLLVSLNANMLALSEREMAVYMDSRKVAEGIYSDIQTVSKNKNVSHVMTRS